MSNREKKLFIKRFYPAGNYIWTVPAGCTEVDVFLVGAGGGCGFTNNWGAWGGGGGGYTKTYRGHGYVAPLTGTWEGTYNEGRDGNAIPVIPGQKIPIIVGAGVEGQNGGYSQFLNENYRADGGRTGGGWDKAGSGSSGGSTTTDNNQPYNGGSDGGDGQGKSPGTGQGHTTRDFGESTGKMNAGGGSSVYNLNYSSKIPKGGLSDYPEGTGEYYDVINIDNPWRSGFPGGGYGGGAGPSVDRHSSTGQKNTKGGDGTVLIRYWAYEE